MTYQPFPAFAKWRVDVDSAIVDRYFHRLRDAKATSTPDRLDAAVTEAMRSAAVDTGAIEGLYTTDRGFTRTVAVQAAAWELIAAEKGPHVQRSIEDAIAGYELVLDAVTRSQIPVITEAWIRRLHEIMLANQTTYRAYVQTHGGTRDETRHEFQDQLLPRGEYKQQPNFPVTASGEIHYYAPPSDTPAEMARFVGELRTAEFEAAHPVVQAAYAHYAFVCIHPFVDGNGRVARALASVYLYRNPGVPLVIFADQKNDYFDALESADRDDPVPLVRFFTERVIDTVGLVTQTLSASPRPTASAAKITAAMREWMNDGLRLAGNRLAQLCRDQLQSQLSTYALPGRLKLRVDGENLGDRPTPPGYALVGPDCWVNIHALTRSDDITGASRLHHSYAVAAQTGSIDAPELLVLAFDDSSPLEVWRREIDPTVSMPLGLKLNTWAQAAAAGFIKALSDALQAR